MPINRQTLLTDLKSRGVSFRPNSFRLLILVGDGTTLPKLCGQAVPITNEAPFERLPKPLGISPTKN